ncbi:UMP kinase [Candidatus Neptunichlamydia sp. REUL1]|uniref:UMP kinase n=1 Tax=Candidatus Neptunichlamydia sp. REUL1 TaxID=3064277 RepID=UPI00292F011F|nr:UMP kinase [Candidatus Neptunochlamydia sp. REUL1]
MTKPSYKRVLLKLSGESLKGETPGVIDHVACNQIANAICEVYALGIEIGVVIGGGNIFRGNMAEQFGFARTPADHVGMLATTINGLILGQVLSTKGCKTRVMSALNFDGIVEPYNWNHALHSLDKGHIVIFVGGTGNPYFTTDTTAAMRASEIEAEVLLKATKVDGIYDMDPMEHKEAVKSDHLTYGEVLTKDLHVMDGAAIALCRESDIPIHVFNLFEKGAMLKAVTDRKGGTLVTKG